MRVILDFPGRRRAFRAPRQVISADRAEDVPQALAAIAEALGQAAMLQAGWVTRLGYALEPRLAPLLQSDMPLLRLGVFDAPSASVPQAVGRAYAGPLVR